jgi:phosphoglycolate phosphatase-like HAD superfamily hydrolase
MTAVPHVLLWDVDGTLLTTKRAGVLALEEAAREVLALEPDIAGLHTAGLTDYQVAVAAISACGREAEPSTVQRFMRSYETHLPARLPLRAGHAMPGVREILDALRDRSDVISLLLTGNTRAGAEAKLRHYGLDGYFDGGAFCVDAGDRDSIARRAVTAAQGRTHAPPDPARTFVIGDTPHDIRCARAIGARSVAVSGTFPVAVLEEHGPWLALDGFPEPDRFLELLEIR